VLWKTNSELKEDPFPKDTIPQVHWLKTKTFSRFSFFKVVELLAQILQTIAFAKLLFFRAQT